MKRQFLWAAGLGVALIAGAQSASAGTPLKCDFEISNNFTSNPRMSGQLDPTRTASTCGGGETPVVDNGGTTYRYEKYSFQNRTGQPTACVTVTLLETPSSVQSYTGVQVAAYNSSGGSGGFNPANPLQNWLGDPGSPTQYITYGSDAGAGTSFSVTVSDTFDIVVNEYKANQGPDYQLSVAGCGGMYVSGIVPIVGSTTWGVVDGGQTYTINGSGFITDGGAVTVTLEGVDASATVLSDDQIQVQSSPWPGDAAALMSGALGNVVVTVPVPYVPGGQVGDGGANVATVDGGFTYYNWIPTSITYLNDDAGRSVESTTFGQAVPITAYVNPDNTYPIPPGVTPGGTVRFDQVGATSDSWGAYATESYYYDGFPGDIFASTNYSGATLTFNQLGSLNVSTVSGITSASFTWDFNNATLPLVPQPGGPTSAYCLGPALCQATAAYYSGDGIIFLPGGENIGQSGEEVRHVGRPQTNYTWTVDPTFEAFVNQDPTLTFVTTSPNGAELDTPISVNIWAYSDPSYPIPSAQAYSTTPPSGTFTLYVDGTQFGSPITPTWNAGVSQLQASTTLPGWDGGAGGVGPHTIAVVYSGDNNYAPADGGTSQTITVDPTNVTITPVGGASTTFGNGIAFTVAVSDDNGITPTGTVTATDSESGTLSCALTSASGGTATFTCTETDLTSLISNLSVTASYTGASNNTGADSTTATNVLYIGQAGTTTTPGGPSSIVYGDPLTLTANIATGPDAGALQAVTGPVTFTYTVGSGGPVTLCSTSVSSGSASCATGNGQGPAIPPGATITATYSGDGLYYAGSSTPVSVTVALADSGVTMTNSNDGGTVVFGDPVTLSTNVTTTDSNALAFGGPSQNVTFTNADAGTTLCMATLNNSGSPSQGSCTLPAAALSVGTHYVQAVYGGDSYYTGSTSTIDPITVTKAPTTVTITAPAADAGETTSGTFNVNVQVSASANALHGGSPSGAITLSVSAGTFNGPCTLTSPTGAPATATCSVTAPATGEAFTITANYAGDGNYTGNSSASLALNALVPPPIDAGFDSSTPPEAGVDATVDSGFDSSVPPEAGIDSSVAPEAGVEAGIDAAQPAEAGIDAAQPAEAGIDAGVDAAHDAAADTAPAAEAGIEAGIDAGHDAAPEGGSVAEAGTDAAADAAHDAAPEGGSVAEAGTDAAADAAHDAGSDAIIVVAEAGTDAAQDAAPDTTPDAAPDASEDAAPDASEDAAPDATPDATTDATADAATDATSDAMIDAMADAMADAATDASEDAAPDASDDGGFYTPPPSSSSCSCKTAGASGSSSTAPLLALLGIAMVVARRRRR